MKTIAYISLIVILTIGLIKTVSPQDCQWSSHAGGTLSDGAGAVSTDLAGNMYVFGSTSSNLCYFQTDTITQGALNTLFLVKYNPSGTEEWVIPFRSPNSPSSDIYTTIGGIEIDTIHNHILLAGSFYSYLVLPDTTLYGNDRTVFLVNMDTDGHTIWAKTAGGMGDDEAFDLTYDDQSNIYISGASDDSITFDSTTIPRGGFLAKYNMHGNLIWAKNKFRYHSTYPVGSNYPYTEALPLNLTLFEGSLIINGNTMNDTIIIDTIVRIVPEGYFASYLSAFSLDGNIQWFQFAGGPQGASGYQTSTDNNGNIYVSGLYGNYGVFDTDTLFSLTQYGDAFIAKYSIEGIYHWSRNLRSSIFSWGEGLHSDVSNNIYFSGYFSGTAQFGSAILISGSNSDMFLAKFSPEGTCVGVRQYSKGQIPEIDVDNQGNVCLAGGFENTLEIGPNTFTSRGWTDLFAAKCSPITGLPQPLESSSNTLLIYANPNTGQCTITIPEEFRQEKNLRLQIYDQTGRLIQETRIEMAGETVGLDISAQAKGIYHAVLSNGKKSYSGKIVFE